MMRFLISDPSVVDDAEITAARARGQALDAAEPRAAAIAYDAPSRRFVLELTNGCAFVFPASLAPDLAEARDADLALVEIQGAGRGLHWPELDVDLTVPGLLMGVFGAAGGWLAREQARRAGAASSPAKAAAARENGRKGGRPRRAARPAG